MLREVLDTEVSVLTSADQAITLGLWRDFTSAVKRIASSKTRSWPISLGALMLGFRDWLQKRVKGSPADLGVGHILVVSRFQWLQVLTANPGLESEETLP